MKIKLAVENSLDNYIQFFQESGCQVEKIDNLKNTSKIHSFGYDAIVVSNLNEIPMDGHSFRPGAPIIEAKNKTPEEVFNLLRARY